MRVPAAGMRAAVSAAEKLAGLPAEPATNRNPDPMVLRIRASAVGVVEPSHAWEDAARNSSSAILTPPVAPGKGHFTPTQRGH